MHILYIDICIRFTRRVLSNEGSIGLYRVHDIRYEVTIYERGSRDMRTRPFSYPQPFPTSFPALGCPYGNRYHYRAELRPGNILWKFGLAFFLNFVPAPGGVPCHRGLPTRRPRGKPKVCCFGCVLLQGFVLEARGGGDVFWFSLALHYIAFLSITLHDFAYLVLSYMTLYRVTAHCCNSYNSLLL
jgi:hypothetical protein